LPAEEKSRFRTLSGPWHKAEWVLGIAVPAAGMFFILDVPMYLTGKSFFTQQYLGLFLGLVLALAFLLLPMSKSAPRDRVPWYDLVFAVASLAVGAYVLFLYPQLIRTMGIVSPDKIVLGLLAIFLVLEATRRVTGWPLTIIVLVFIAYGRYGYLLPDVVAGSDASWGRLINQLFLGSGSLYGIALRVAALIVFAFVFLAHGLFGYGGGDFLFGVAQTSMGRYRGGPAKMAVLASAFFGMLSGSAVANVAGTGTITIPLMKKNGYSPEFASAVEAVASTGGTVTPPVMGAAGFIIAEFLGVGYSEVVLIAIVPALLYYLGLFIQIDLRAVKKGLKGLPNVTRLPVGQLFTQGWLYLAALGILMYGLFFLYLRPEVAALYALGTLIVLGSVSKRTRQGLTGLLTILRTTGRGMLEITVIGAAAGIVIGVVNYTGLGLSLSRLLTDLSGGSLLLLALMTAVASIILGMGIPVTASYLFLAVLAAPALVQRGVPPLVAHMFIFYFGAFSFITPPICLAVFTAASIGGANQMKTALQAMRLAVAGYLVPFIFLFDRGVVLQGTPSQIAVGVLSAIAAIIAFCFALEGYFLRRLGWRKRVLYVAAGTALLIPGHWSLNVVGGGAMAGLMLLDMVWVRKHAKDSRVKAMVGSESA